MGKTKVRTTFTPAIVNEVEKAELIDLSRGGLLHSHETTKDTESLELESKHEWRDVEDEAKPAKAAKPKASAKTAKDTPAVVESGVITDDAPNKESEGGK